MYTILFHLAGIAILEISFYFYYVGPMETKMFDNTVRQLVNEPINNIDSQIISASKINQIIYILYDIPLTSNITKQDELILENKQNQTMVEMKQMNDIGMVERNVQNHDLFMLAIKFWVILCIVSIVTFFIQRICTYKKIHNDSSNEDDYETDNIRLMDLGYVRPYRKGSIDDEYIDIIPNNSQNSNKYDKMKYVKTTIYYSLFGGCILTFQYLFFSNIVYYYKPMSIQEVKYILYKCVSNDIASY